MFVGVSDGVFVDVLVGVGISLGASHRMKINMRAHSKQAYTDCTQKSTWKQFETCVNADFLSFTP